MLDKTIAVVRTRPCEIEAMSLETEEGQSKKGMSCSERKKDQKFGTCVELAREEVLLIGSWVSLGSFTCMWKGNKIYITN